MTTTNSTLAPKLGSGRNASTDLGNLHDLLMRGLPDYNGDRGFDVRRLAADLNVSYQAVYKWFARESIAPSRIVQIVEMSEQSLNGDDNFTPLSRDDFWKFMSG